jgi:hypothetical protein
MPGLNRFTYKYRLDSQGEGVPPVKFCTMADLVNSEEGKQLGLTIKNVYRIRQGFYKTKFQGVHIEDIYEKRPTKQITVLAEEENTQQ